MVKSENYLPKSSSKSARQVEVKVKVKVKVEVKVEVEVKVVVQVFASHIFEIALEQASFAAGVW